MNAGVRVGMTAGVRVGMTAGVRVGIRTAARRQTSNVLTVTRGRQPDGSRVPRVPLR